MFKEYCLFRICLHQTVKSHNGYKSTIDLHQTGAAMGCNVSTNRNAQVSDFDVKSGHSIAQLNTAHTEKLKTFMKTRNGSNQKAIKGKDSVVIVNNTLGPVSLFGNLYQYSSSTGSLLDLGMDIQPKLFLIGSPIHSFVSTIADGDDDSVVTDQSFGMERLPSKEEGVDNTTYIREALRKIKMSDHKLQSDDPSVQALQKVWESQECVFEAPDIFSITGSVHRNSTSGSDNQSTSPNISVNQKSLGQSNKSSMKLLRQSTSKSAVVKQTSLGKNKIISQPILSHTTSNTKSLSKSDSTKESIARTEPSMSLKTSLNTFIADQRLTHDESTNPKSDQLGKVEQLQPEDSLKFSNVKTVNDDFNSPEDDFITEDSQKFKTNSTEFRYHAPYEKTNSYSLRKSTTDQSINSGVNSEGHFRRSKTTQRENENTLTRLLSKHTSTSEMDPFKTKLDDTNGMRRSSTTHRANSIRSNSSLSRMNSARDKSSMKLPSNMDDTLSRQRSRLIEGSLPIIVDPAPDLEPFVMSTSVLNDTIEESEVKSTFEISNEREHIKLLIEKSMEGREIEEVGEEEEEDGKFEKNAIQGSIQEEESGQIEEEIPYRRSIRIMPDTIQEGSDENIPGEFGVTDTENSKQLASIMESIIPRNNSNLSEIIVEKGPIAKTDMIPKMESWAKENSISSTNAHVSQSQLSSSETQIVDTSLFSKTVGQPKNFNSTNQNLSDSLQETFL